MSNLILTREEGDSIVIGDDVLITVVDVDRPRKQVRLSIQAPKDIKIVRLEVLERAGRKRLRNFDDLLDAAKRGDKYAQHLIDDDVLVRMSSLQDKF